MIERLKLEVLVLRIAEMRVELLLDVLFEFLQTFLLRGPALLDLLFTP